MGGSSSKTQISKEIFDPDNTIGRYQFGAKYFIPIFGHISTVQALAQSLSYSATDNNAFGSYIITPEFQPLSKGISNRELFERFGITSTQPQHYPHKTKFYCRHGFGDPINKKDILEKDQVLTGAGYWHVQTETELRKSEDPQGPNTVVNKPPPVNNKNFDNIDDFIDQNDQKKTTNNTNNVDKEEPCFLKHNVTYPPLLIRYFNTNTCSKDDLTIDTNSLQKSPQIIPKTIPFYKISVPNTFRSSGSTSDSYDNCQSNANISHSIAIALMTSTRIRRMVSRYDTEILDFMAKFHPIAGLGPFSPPLPPIFNNTKEKQQYSGITLPPPIFAQTIPCYEYDFSSLSFSQEFLKHIHLATILCLDMDSFGETTLSQFIRETINLLSRGCTIPLVNIPLIVIINNGEHLDRDFSIKLNQNLISEQLQLLGFDLIKVFFFYFHFLPLKIDFTIDSIPLTRDGSIHFDEEPLKPVLLNRFETNILSNKINEILLEKHWSLSQGREGEGKGEGEGKEFQEKKGEEKNNSSSSSWNHPQWYADHSKRLDIPITQGAEYSSDVRYLKDIELKSLEKPYKLILDNTIEKKNIQNNKNKLKISINNFLPLKYYKFDFSILSTMVNRKGSIELHPQDPGYSTLYSLLRSLHLYYIIMRYAWNIGIHPLQITSDPSKPSPLFYLFDFYTQQFFNSIPHDNHVVLYPINKKQFISYRDDDYGGCNLIPLHPIRYLENPLPVQMSLGYSHYNLFKIPHRIGQVSTIQINAEDENQEGIRVGPKNKNESEQTKNKNDESEHRMNKIEDYYGIPSEYQQPYHYISKSTGLPFDRAFMKQVSSDKLSALFKSLQRAKIQSQNATATPNSLVFAPTAAPNSGSINFTSNSGSINFTSNSGSINFTPNSGPINIASNSGSINFTSNSSSINFTPNSPNFGPINFTSNSGPAVTSSNNNQVDDEATNPRTMNNVNDYQLQIKNNGLITLPPSTFQEYTPPMPKILPLGILPKKLHFESMILFHNESDRYDAFTHPIDIQSQTTTIPQGTYAEQKDMIGKKEFTDEKRNELRRLQDEIGFNFFGSKNKENEEEEEEIFENEENLKKLQISKTTSGTILLKNDKLPLFLNKISQNVNTTLSIQDYITKTSQSRGFTHFTKKHLDLSYQFLHESILSVNVQQQSAGSPNIILSIPQDKSLIPPIIHKMNDSMSQFHHVSIQPLTPIHTRTTQTFYMKTDAEDNNDGDDGDDGDDDNCPGRMLELSNGQQNQKSPTKTQQDSTTISTTTTTITNSTQKNNKLTKTNPIQINITYTSRQSKNISTHLDSSPNYFPFCSSKYITSSNNSGYGSQSFLPLQFLHIVYVIPFFIDNDTAKAKFTSTLPNKNNSQADANSGNISSQTSSSIPPPNSLPTLIPPCIPSLCEPIDQYLSGPEKPLFPTISSLYRSCNESGIWPLSPNIPKSLVFDPHLQESLTKFNCPITFIIACQNTIVEDGEYESFENQQLQKNKIKNKKKLCQQSTCSNVTSSQGTSNINDNIDDNIDDKPLPLSPIERSVFDYFSKNIPSLYKYELIYKIFNQGGKIMVNFQKLELLWDVKWCSSNDIPQLAKEAEQIAIERRLEAMKRHAKESL